MNKMLKSPVFWIALYALAAYGGYALYKNSKMFYVGAIRKMGLSKQDASGLKTFDKDFLAAWYNGGRDKTSFFLYNGEKYNTKGGKKLI
jgi:hypothetical protein